MSSPEIDFLRALDLNIDVRITVSVNLRAETYIAICFCFIEIYIYMIYMRNISLIGLIFVHYNRHSVLWVLVFNALRPRDAIWQYRIDICADSDLLTNAIKPYTDPVLIS